jgi:hypothetical protein
MAAAKFGSGARDYPRRGNFFFIRRRAASPVRGTFTAVSVGRRRQKGVNAGFCHQF